MKKINLSFFLKPVVLKKAYLVLFPFSFPIVKYLSFLNQNNIQALSEKLPLICPLYFLTQIICPTCGMTRATLAAFNFKLSESFAYHPLGIPFVLFLIFLWLIFYFGKENILFKYVKSSDAFLVLSINKVKFSVLSVFCIWGFSRNFL